MTDIHLKPTGAETPLFRIFFIISALIFGLALLMSLLLPSGFFLLMVLAILLIAILAGTLLSMLYSRYSALPLVHRKNTELQKLMAITSKWQAADNELKITVAARDQLIATHQKHRHETEHAHNGVLEKLEGEQKALRKACENDLRESLRSLREQFVNQALLTKLSDVHIPGIGPVMIERLANRGVVLVSQLSPIALSNVPGLGDAKTSTILQWRSQFEREAIAKAPSALDQATFDAIRTPYLEKEAALEIAKTQAKERHAAYLLEHESKVNQTERLWAPQIVEKQAQRKPFDDAIAQQKLELAPFAAVTYWKYLESCLQLPILPVGRASILVNTILVMSCVCLLTGAVAGSGGWSFVNSLPTLTSTPTATCTSSPTSTSTQTFTPTITSTFTLTLSPTITLTPSLTFIPTITPTNMFTPTLTLTKTLTPTITNTRLPVTNTPYRCGTLCKDNHHSDSLGGPGTCSGHGGVAGPIFCN